MDKPLLLRGTSYRRLWRTRPNARPKIRGLWSVPLLCTALVQVWGYQSALAQTVPTLTTLTRSEAVRLALEGHTEIQAARAGVSASDGLILQGGFRPNPTFTFQTENWRFYGTPGFETSQDLDLFVFLSQPLEASEKRSRRVDYSERGKDIAQLEARSVEWRVQQGVKEAFLRAVLAQDELRLARENLANFEKITEYHRIRVAEGEIAEAELIRVLLEQERLALDQGEAALKARQAHLGLRKAMGRDDLSSDLVLEMPQATRAVPGGETETTLTAKGRRTRFEVLRAQAELARLRSRLQLETSQAKPDWNLILGYKRTEGYNTLLGGFSLPLRFFDDNRGNIRFAEGQVAQAEAALEGRLRSIELEISAAADSLRQRHRIIRQMEEGMVERAEESLDIALSAYQEGATDLLRLLDAQRTRNEVQLLHIRNLLEFEIAVVGLETAVGEENLLIGEELLRESEKP